MRKRLESTLDPEYDEEANQPVSQSTSDGVFPDPADGWVLSTEVKIIRSQVTALVATVEGLVRQQAILHSDIERLSK
jgi:hypothetical protein